MSTPSSRLPVYVHGLSALLASKAEVEGNSFHRKWVPDLSSSKVPTNGTWRLSGDIVIVVVIIGAKALNTFCIFFTFQVHKFATNVSPVSHYVCE